MRLLVIEDENKIAQALKRGLVRERFAVDVIHDGEEGLHTALAGEHDLIILDRMLPSLDGLSVCQALRAQGVRTPVLMLTAKDRTMDKIDGLDGGADDYLVKPFSFDELLARIRALLRRPVVDLGTILQADDVTLNPVTFEVFRGDTPLTLTHKEFALLDYLLRNPNRVLSKDAIIQHVWDFDADILPNTVEVYMGSLRSKIDKPFPGKPQLLRTVRGFGYKLEA